MKPRPFLKWLGYGLILLAVFVEILILCAAFNGRGGFVLFFGIIGLLAYLYLLFFVYQPKRLRKIFLQQKSIQLPYAVAITDDGYQSKSEISDEKMPWNHFIRWREGKNLFVLYQSDVQIRMIPKRCLAAPEQINEFRQWLEKKLGPAKV